MLTASSGKRNVTAWRPSVCLSVPSFSDLDRARGAYTHRDSLEAARDAASVHFGPTVRRTDILVTPMSVSKYH